MMWTYRNALSLMGGAVLVVACQEAPAGDAASAGSPCRRTI